jgi:hypothetical protein
MPTPIQVHMKFATKPIWAIFVNGHQVTDMLRAPNRK